MNKTLKLVITLIIFGFYNNSINAQMIIQEIKAVYKSNVDGRIIPEKEFQTYKGTHTFHKIIKGKNGVDTLLITPPKKKLVKNLNKGELVKEMIGKPIHPFNVVDIYGNSFSSEELKGKVLVLNFWFVACPPCITEIPDLNILVDDFKDNKDIVFIAFAKDTKPMLGKFLAHTEFDYSIIPNSSKIGKKNKISAYPTNMIVDKKGILRYASVGYNEKVSNEMKNEILKVYKE